MRYRALPLLLCVVVTIVVIFLYIPHPLSFLQKDPLSLTAEMARHRRHALIVDVRTPKEREEFGFFPESIPIDPSRVVEEVPFLLGQRPGINQQRPTPILVYSNAGDGRAQRVANQLYDIGFIGVRYLKGSYLDMLPPGPMNRQK